MKALTELEPMFTPAEIAQAYRISRRAVLDAIRSGELVGEKPFPNVVRVSASALAQWRGQRQMRRPE